MIADCPSLAQTNGMVRIQLFIQQALLAILFPLIDIQFATSLGSYFPTIKDSRFNQHTH